METFWLTLGWVLAFIFALGNAYQWYTKRDLQVKTGREPSLTPAEEPMVQKKERLEPDTKEPSEAEPIVAKVEVQTPPDIQPGPEEAEDENRASEEIEEPEHPLTEKELRNRNRDFAPLLIKLTAMRHNINPQKGKLDEDLIKAAGNHMGKVSARKFYKACEFYEQARQAGEKTSDHSLDYAIKNSAQNDTPEKYTLRGAERVMRALVDVEALLK